MLCHPSICVKNIESQDSKLRVILALNAASFNPFQVKSMHIIVHASKIRGPIVHNIAIKSCDVEAFNNMITL